MQGNPVSLLESLVTILGGVLSGVLVALGSSLKLCVKDIVLILAADTTQLFSCLQNSVNYLMNNGIGSLFGLTGLLGAIIPTVGGILSGLLPVVLNQIVLGLVSQFKGLLP